MQHDLQCGRKTAIDITTGALLRVAKRHNIRAPACQAVHDLLSAAVAAGGRTPAVSPQDLYVAAGRPTYSACALRRKAALWLLWAGGAVLLAWCQRGALAAALLSVAIAVCAALRYVVFTSTTQ
ncbi:hypothetical protein JKP88DRAFT_234191 [Tribonema minus]|uniref:Ketopantoate reductase C-terminal domain-containing protein n=1 Tax=Tribonema minus TaxID=303371 RepID=A0A836CKE8_9STRA|nr:hypothetical protein JKP88DRAFT_234191 [Tribonema minus]